VREYSGKSGTDRRKATCIRMADAPGAARARELRKGQAARAQQDLWHKALELRVLLSRSLSSAHQLPRAQAHASLLSQSVSARASFASIACRRAIGRIEALRRLLVAQSEDVLASVGSKRKRSPRDALSQLPPLPSDQLWHILDSGYQDIAPFRDAALDRWYRRAHVSSGRASGSVVQGVAEQVEASLSSSNGRAHEKSRLPMRLLPRRVGEADQSAHNQPMKPSTGPPAHTHNDEDSVEDEPSARSLKHEEREAATYDDSDFYQQLLKEFLESTKASEQPELAQRAQKTREKRKKEYHRKASRERKLKYTVHPEVVNFTTAADDNPHTIAPHLFENLLGVHDPANATGLKHTLRE